jgi:DNA recombination protein RmuC
MSIYLLTILIILISGFLGIIIYLLISKKGEKETLIHQQIESLRKSLTDAVFELTKTTNDQIKFMQERIDFLQKNVGQRLDNAARTIGDVQKSLGALEKVTEEIKDISKDISSLQDILKPPKLRGALGETLLAEILEQILPKEYFRLQYNFRTGEKVDAVIVLKNGILPIDAKFPLENFLNFMNADKKEKEKFKKEFTRDVKKHIDDISRKYIRPSENTLDFAMMYIPAENIYYEVILKEDKAGENLISYALSRKVIPVSPNSLYAYLQAILMGLQGMEIEKKAKSILVFLQELRKNFVQFSKDFETLGNHLRNARNKYEDIRKNIEKISFKLNGISKGEISEQDKKELPLF